jgi:hypothetical protein
MSVRGPLIEVIWPEVLSVSVVVAMVPDQLVILEARHHSLLYADSAA